MTMARALRRVVPLVLFLGFVALLLPVQLGGQVAYVIVDGTSMEPTYDDGDLVIVRERARYAEGDVIAFAVPDDDLPAPYRVIHRIAERDADGTFVTVGDNRDERDPWPLTGDDVIGSAWLHLPNVGTWLVELRARPLLMAWVAALLTFVLLMPSSRRHDDVDDETAEPADPDLRASGTTAEGASVGAPSATSTVRERR